MNRDPTELARVAPQSELLASALDALVVVLELVEQLPVEDIDDDLREAAAHARAWWGHLMTRTCEAERDVDRRVREYAAGDSTLALPVDFGRTGPGQR